MTAPRPAQWDVHWTATGDTRILIVQSDILSETGMRIVVPIVRGADAPGHHPRLQPVITLGDETWVALVLAIGTLDLSEIGARIASAEGARDEIARALDMVLSGV
ncbi:MAG: CcdB family protein [Jannaschia sp.]